MKSLILKDIYNIMHNMKALVLMLFIFLFITCLLYTSDAADE